MQHVQARLHEVKLAAGDGVAGEFSGYGAVFGNIDAYGDVIAPGAFADTLASGRQRDTWPAMLSHHGGFGLGADDLTPVGIWTELGEDGHGLKVKGKLADTPRGRELHALMKMDPRPAIDGLSIGYIAKEWSPRSKPEDPRRTLKKVDLIEISLVTFPANPRARVQSVKSGLTTRDAEKALRDAGFSAREAKAIIAEGFNGITAARDAGTDADEQTDELRRLLSLIPK